MDLDFALLADAATVDSSGKLNVLGVFDRIHAREFPVRHGRIALVLRFSAGADELGAHTVEIRLRTPGGKELLNLNGKMELGGGPRGAAEGIKVPHVLNLDGITFPEAGRYIFEISVDGEPLASFSLSLQEAGGPGPQGSRPEGESLPPFVMGPSGGAKA